MKMILKCLIHREMFFNNSAEDGVSGGFAFDSHHTKGVPWKNLLIFFIFFYFWTGCREELGDLILEKDLYFIK